VEENKPEMLKRSGHCYPCMSCTVEDALSGVTLVVMRDFGKRPTKKHGIKHENNYRWL
jgi:hypothetical protein